MKKSLLLTVFPCALLGALSSAPSIALDWSLEAGIEGRRFIEEAAYPKQVDDQWSLSLQPEMVWDSEGGNGRFTLTPFYRYDHVDSERTHADIREAMYMTWDGQWEVRAGIGRVFWGVTESLHRFDFAWDKKPSNRSPLAQHRRWQGSEHRVAHAMCHEIQRSRDQANNRLTQRC